MICDHVLIRGLGLSVASRTSSSSLATIPAVELNQVIACVPTCEAREADKKVGYNLPFSLGRVVELNGSGVVVIWLFSRHMDGVWCLWEEGKNGACKPRRDDLDWADILRDEAGVVSIQFCADKTFKKSTLSRLKANPMLAMSQVEWGSYFRKQIKV
jgi:hypothetical protein